MVRITAFLLITAIIVSCKLMPKEEKSKTDIKSQKNEEQHCMEAFYQYL